MNRRNFLKILLLLLLVVLIFSYIFGIHLSPKKAFESLESYHNYGPSNIVFTEDFKDFRVYIASYEDYFSSMKLKKFGPFFKASSYSYGYYKNPNEDLNFVLGYSDYNLVFGSINNAQIDYLLLEFNNGSREKLQNFKQSMFMYSWEPRENRELLKISAFNRSGEKLYEEDI